MKRLPLILFILLALPSVCWGATHQVGSGQTFTTISAAIASGSVSNGDILNIHAGTYRERIFITKQLTLQGASGEAIPVIDGEYTRPCTIAAGCQYDGLVEIDANNVTLDRLRIRRSGGALVNYVDYSNLTITNCILDDSSWHAIRGKTAGALTVSNTIMYTMGTHYEYCNWDMTWCRDHYGTRADGSGVNLDRMNGACKFTNCSFIDSYGQEALSWFETQSGGSLTVDSCIFYGNNHYDVFITGGKNVEFKNCLLYGTTDPIHGQTTNGEGDINFYIRCEQGGPGNSENITIRDCFIASKGEPFRINVQAGMTDVIRNVKIYNNTIVDSTYYLNSISTNGGSGNVFKNNLIVDSGSTTLSSVGFTVANNTIRTGSSTAYSAAGLSKTSGWTSLTSGSIDQSSFALTGGPAVDAGTYLCEVNDTGGSLTDVNVDDGTYFKVGQLITIKNGANKRQITLTGVSGNNISWSGAQTIADNDDVFHRHYTGYATDNGGYEYMGSENGGVIDVDSGITSTPSLRLF